MPYYACKHIGKNKLKVVGVADTLSALKFILKIEKIEGSILIVRPIKTINIKTKKK